MTFKIYSLLERFIYTIFCLPIFISRQRVLTDEDSGRKNTDYSKKYFQQITKFDSTGGKRFRFYIFADSVKKVESILYTFSIPA